METPASPSRDTLIVSVCMAAMALLAIVLLALR